MSEEAVCVRESDRCACAKYLDAKGAPRYLYAKTKPEVRRKRRQVLKDCDDGSILPSKVSVDTLLDEWLEDMQDVAKP